MARYSWEPIDPENPDEQIIDAELERDDIEPSTDPVTRLAQVRAERNELAIKASLDGPIGPSGAPTEDERRYQEERAKQLEAENARYAELGDQEAVLQRHIVGSDDYKAVLAGATNEEEVFAAMKRFGSPIAGTD